METNHFVLSFAVFMIIVTLIYAISQWNFDPAPKKFPGYACRFEGYCKGTDCSAPLPQDILIFPAVEDGKAYYHSPADSFWREALDTQSEREWVGRRGERGKVRFSLRETGALTVTEYAGFDDGSDILSVANGICREVIAASGEPG